ncbi:lipopolysaccharide core heptose(II)-phosphate phosphatase Ais [Escherichia coli]|nr:lipopolysaccharide core heptose(II)-phosphate phosphatase Ais [Escherichia coli]EFB3367143.1 histidine phosphatase family protein [Escherichia coli]EFE3316617.1 histidine phosphatase family protein [Escherichia coli]EFH3767567.1 lipopolysaccharide core heptose(II)-phosphate phosphatase [Escherichia coli]EFH3889586.1 lipopolysaccharide core heptose(II)-phosphate phosphatase [Escherichia coli]EFN5970925.1 histidine phosphatase family protein [Escherichia coli]
MLAFCRSSLKSKKYIIILLALAAIAGLGTHAAWSSNGLPRIDNKTLARLARLAQQHPVVVLFRHAERCDRSTNQCLSDKTGITVKGTQDARELGNAFSADIPDFDLYSSNTVRTIQSATWFSAGKKLTVDKRLLQCGNEIYSAIKDLQSKAPDKNIVIFTHNHCLTYIAKDKRDATFKPDYLDGLVMHVEKGKVYLDGEFVNH